MVKLKMDVTTHGPIFQNAPQQVRREMGDAVRELVEMGEQRLDKVLQPRPAGVYLSVGEAKRGQASTGHYRRSVTGRVTDTPHPQGVISDGGVVYGPWLEGVGRRNLSSRFKGYASFRKTGQWLGKQAKKVLQAHVSRLVRRLNGGV